MSDEIKTSQYTFDQIENALSNIVQPIAEGEQTTTFTKFGLRNSVESNLKKIDDLTKTVGTFSVPDNTLGSAVTALWKESGSEDGVSGHAKINKLMETVGYEVDENNTIVKMDDENTLINKVDMLLGVKPVTGILSNKVPERGVRLKQKDMYEEDTIVDENEKNYYITFRNIPVEENTEYTVLISGGEIYVIWFLDNNLEPVQIEGVMQQPIISLNENNEFKTPEGTSQISITVKELNSTFKIENIVIEKKYVEQEILSTLHILTDEEFAEINKENSWTTDEFLLNEKIKGTILTNYELNTKKTNWRLPVPYKLSSDVGEGKFTAINVEVEESSYYKIISDFEASPKTIFYLGDEYTIGEDKGVNIIGVEIFTDFQDTFWTKPGTKAISISFKGDTSQVKLYKKQAGANEAAFKELFDQDLNAGATFSPAFAFGTESKLDSLKGQPMQVTETTGVLNPSTKYQAVKGMFYDSIDIDKVNELRKSELDSKQNFFINSIGERTKNYEVKIAKSGYYLVTGQVGFGFNFTPNEGSSITERIVKAKAAIVLKNEEEIPVYGQYYTGQGLHFNETYLAESMSYYNISESSAPGSDLKWSEAVKNYDYYYNKICTVAIPPKIVKLKQGDYLTLKGSFDGSSEIHGILKDDGYLTYLTVLKLRDLPQTKYNIKLKPYIEYYHDNNDAAKRVIDIVKTKPDGNYYSNFDIYLGSKYMNQYNWSDLEEENLSSGIIHEQQEDYAYETTAETDSIIFYNITHATTDNGKPVTYYSGNKAYRVTGDETLYIKLGYLITQQCLYGETILDVKTDCAGINETKYFDKNTAPLLDGYKFISFELFTIGSDGSENNVTGSYKQDGGIKSTSNMLVKYIYEKEEIVK